MRIIAGTHRGRLLSVPLTNNIRPTTDRVRESLFSILASRYPDLMNSAQVLDLFAGTGALGLEALSRGARFAMFVEISREGQRLIRKNIEDLLFGDQTSLIRTDAVNLGTISKTKPFNLVFIDPPYAQGLAQKAVANLVNRNWLAPGAIIVIEDKAGSAPLILPFLTMVTERTFGDTTIRVIKYE